MFIFLAYVSLALIQLYRRCQRRLQYSAAMLRALRTGSVLVQRGKHAQHGSVGALLNSSLLSCSRSYKETLLLSDEHVAVSAQQVDLGEWTSYLDLHPPQTSSSSVVALLEAGPPEHSDNTAQQQTPSPSRVHVLKHGCPLAWKCSEPFGVILHCSYEDFVILCDALGQGQLVLNEDLHLHRMLTISTVGKPKSLRRPRSEDVTSTLDKTDSLKTRRANTDPECMLAAVQSNPQVTSAAVCDVAKANSDAKLTAKAATALDRSPAQQEESVYTEGAGSVSENASVSAVYMNSTAASEKWINTSEKLVNGEDKTVNDNSDHSSKVTSNGNAVLVRETSIVLEESPVVQISADFANGFEKDSQSLSSNTSGKLPTLSSDTVYRSNSLDLQEDEKPEVLLSSDSKHVTSKSIPTGSDLNSCGKYSGENDFPSTTDSELQSAHSEKEENTKVTVTENAASVSQTNMTTASTVSENSQDVKTDEKSSAVFSDSQQGSSKPTDRVSVNGSASSFNGSRDGSTFSTPSSQPPRTTVSEAGDTTVSSHKSSLTSQGEKGKASPSEPSANSENGIHSANGGKSGCKPPNVVVYCGKKDSARKFDMIKEGLEQCLNTNAYTVYILPHEEVMTLPWEDNSAVLVISHDYLHDNIGKKFTNFLLNGGKVISFGSSMEAEFLVRKEVKGCLGVAKFNLQKWQDVSTVQGHYHYVPGSLKKGNSSMDTLVADPATAQPLVVQLTLSSENGNGRAIFSQLFLERDPSEMASDSKTFSRLKQSSQQRREVLRYLLSLLDLDTSVTPAVALTPCYLLVQDQRKSFLDSIASRMKQNVIRSRTLSLKFVTSKSESSALTATSDTLPVVTDIPAGSFKGIQDAGDLQHFDPAVYWRHLTTSVLGRVVMYTEIIPTTMIVFEGIQFSLPEDLGVIAVAGRQTSGKGRGGNQWLSPMGCAMFTLPLRLPVESHLGQHISFLQHMASLAVVHSVRTLPGYEDLDLRLKWPNDIYYGTKAKLGGVLVNSTIMGKTMHATIGCGVNVSNSLPTICINSIIWDHNQERGSNLQPLTTSEVLARTVSTMETLLTQFQAKGHQDFCQLYYKYWLHSGAHVKVESEGNAAVEIVGLDSFGFLRVVNQQGQQLSVQPDGNSFDIMRNLISVKRD
ncbi:hypothetical protein ACOMHN_015644 [Nucella lapillus]